MANNGNEAGVKNGNGRLSARQTFSIAILSAVLGSTGGNYFLTRVFPDTIRPDPFTGSEGRIQDRRIEQIEYHVRNHPDAAGKFETRIATLEAQNTIIITELRRMNDRLDRVIK